MFEGSNCAGSAWIGAGGAERATRYSVGGVSMPSTVAKARSSAGVVALRWIVDLSGSATGVPLQLPSGARVSAVSRPDTSSRYLIHTAERLAEKRPTARCSVGSNTL